MKKRIYTIEFKLEVIELADASITNPRLAGILGSAQAALETGANSIRRKVPHPDQVQM